jgi:hypothetical protein
MALCGTHNGDLAQEAYERDRYANVLHGRTTRPWRGSGYAEAVGLPRLLQCNTTAIRVQGTTAQQLIIPAVLRRRREFHVRLFLTTRETQSRRRHYPRRMRLGCNVDVCRIGHMRIMQPTGSSFHAQRIRTGRFHMQSSIMDETSHLSLLLTYQSTPLARARVPTVEPGSPILQGRLRIGRSIKAQPYLGERATTPNY